MEIAGLSVCQLAYSIRVSYRYKCFYSILRFISKYGRTKCAPLSLFSAYGLLNITVLCKLFFTSTAYWSFSRLQVLSFVLTSSRFVLTVY